MSYCTFRFHVYPTVYAGDPEYADEFFSRCLCGLKKKVTTVVEVNADQLNQNLWGKS